MRPVNSHQTCNLIGALLSVVGLALIAPKALYETSQHSDVIELLIESDFLEYWGAFKLWSAGLNPYLGSFMLSIQRATAGVDAPIMMWNPPWLLTMLSPILSLPFKTALIVWVVFNLTLAWGSVEILIRAFNARELRFLLFGLVLLLLPTRSSLDLGQLGILLLFGSSLFVWGKVTEQSLVTGSGIAICSVKPHLFALILMIMIWELLSKRDYRNLSLSFVPLIILVGSTFFINGLIFQWWFDSLTCRTSPAPAPSVLDWITPNLPYLVRHALQPLLSGTQFAHPALQIMLFPFFLMFISLALLIRFAPKLNWLVLFGPLLAISTYVAPFGWVFDQTVLGVLICQILVESRHSNKAFWLSLGMILLWEMALLGWELVSQHQHEIPPSGPALLAIWFIAKHFQCSESQSRFSNAK